MKSRRGQTYVIPKTNIRLDFPFSTTLWTPQTTPGPSLIASEQNGIAKGHAVRSLPHDLAFHVNLQCTGAAEGNG